MQLWSSGHAAAGHQADQAAFPQRSIVVGETVDSANQMLDTIEQLNRGRRRRYLLSVAETRPSCDMPQPHCLAEEMYTIYRRTSIRRV
jgi:hypothetical protein